MAMPIGIQWDVMKQKLFNWYRVILRNRFNFDTIGSVFETETPVA